MVEEERREEHLENELEAIARLVDSLDEERSEAREEHSMAAAGATGDESGEVHAEEERGEEHEEPVLNQPIEFGSTENVEEPAPVHPPAPSVQSPASTGQSVSTPQPMFNQPMERSTLSIGQPGLESGESSAGSESQPAMVVVDRVAEDVKRKLREALEIYREVVSVAREMSQLPPEDKAWVHSIVSTVLQPPQPQQVVVEKPVVVEKEKPVVVEKPKPVIPREELEEIRSTVMSVKREFEEGLRILDERVKLLEELSTKTAQVLETVSRALERERTLEEELRELRKELEQMKRNPAGQLVVPRAEKLNPDGSIIREYDYHPLLKARLKQVDFATERVGPVLIEEVRATRQEIASIGHRLVTLLEAVLLPELKKRAPQVVNELQEAARRLVKRLSPEEREQELEELEKRVEEKLGGGET